MSIFTNCLYISTSSSPIYWTLHCPVQVVVTSWRWTMWFSRCYLSSCICLLVFFFFLYLSTKSLLIKALWLVEFFLEWWLTASFALGWEQFFITHFRVQRTAERAHHILLYECGDITYPSKRNWLAFDSYLILYVYNQQIFVGIMDITVFAEGLPKFFLSGLRMLLPPPYHHQLDSNLGVKKELLT